MTGNQQQGKKLPQTTNTWRLNNMLLKNEWVNEEIKKEIKNTLREMIMKTQQSKTCKMYQKALNCICYVRHSHKKLMEKTMSSVVDFLSTVAPGVNSGHKFF